MRRIPDHRLWLGHAADARDLATLRVAGILAVVDLAREEPPAVLGRDLAYCRFPLTDGAGNPDWVLRAAVSTVADLLRGGIPTLVACGAGLSRSPTIAALALASVRGESPETALARVTSGAPADLSSAFWKEARAAATVGETEQPEASPVRSPTASCPSRPRVSLPSGLGGSGETVGPGHAPAEAAPQPSRRKPGE